MSQPLFSSNNSEFIGSLIKSLLYLNKFTNNLIDKIKEERFERFNLKNIHFWDTASYKLYFRFLIVTGLVYEHLEEKELLKKIYEILENNNIKSDFDELIKIYIYSYLISTRSITCIDKHLTSNLDKYYVTFNEILRWYSICLGCQYHGHLCYITFSIDFITLLADLMFYNILCDIIYKPKYNYKICKIVKEYYLKFRDHISIVNEIISKTKNINKEISCWPTTYDKNLEERILKSISDNDTLANEYKKIRKICNGDPLTTIANTYFLINYIIFILLTNPASIGSRKNEIISMIESSLDFVVRSKYDMPVEQTKHESFSYCWLSFEPEHIYTAKSSIDDSFFTTAEIMEYLLRSYYILKLSNEKIKDQKLNTIIKKLEKIIKGCLDRVRGYISEGNKLDRMYWKDYYVNLPALYRVWKDISLLVGEDVRNISLDMLACSSVSGVIKRLRLLSWLFINGITSNHEKLFDIMVDIISDMLYKIKDNNLMFLPVTFNYDKEIILKEIMNILGKRYSKNKATLNESFSKYFPGDKSISIEASLEFFEILAWLVFEYVRTI